MSPIPIYQDAVALIAQVDTEIMIWMAEAASLQRQCEEELQQFLRELPASRAELPDLLASISPLFDATSLLYHAGRDRARTARTALSSVADYLSNPAMTGFDENLVAQDCAKTIRVLVAFEDTMTTMDTWLTDNLAILMAAVQRSAPQFAQDTFEALMVRLSLRQRGGA